MNIIKPGNEDEIITAPHSVSEGDIAEVKKGTDMVLAIKDAKIKNQEIQNKQANDLRTQLLMPSITEQLGALSREQLDTIAVKAYRAKDLDTVQNIFLEIQNREYREKKKQDTPNSSLNFFNNPLDTIFQKLDHAERNQIQNSMIKKNPLDRAKDFISSFEERTISEIHGLKGNQDTKKTEQIISKIIFNVGLLARDEKYKNLWQDTKNKIINESMSVLGYNFRNIEKFISVNHAGFEDFWFLMDNKLSWNGIGNRMVITPNGEWYDPKSDIMWQPLEASLYILKNAPYLSYGVAKNLVGRNYESYLQKTDIFWKYVDKYNT